MAASTHGFSLIGYVKWKKFFDYYRWAENKKVKYAKMKLIGRTDLFWEDLEETLKR